MWDGLQVDRTAKKVAACFMLFCAPPFHTMDLNNVIVNTTMPLCDALNGVRTFHCSATELKVSSVVVWESSAGLFYLFFFKPSAPS